MIFLQLIWVFLKIGIFGFGGGYAMLSLIQQEVVYNYSWLTLQEFTDLVVISQVTPGPIGINSATYVGYTAVVNAGYSSIIGVLGAGLCTAFVCLPAFIMILFISYHFKSFMENKIVSRAFVGLRPVSIGLIAAAALILMNPQNFVDYKSVIIFAGTFFLAWKCKMSPILIIVLAAIAGIVLYS